MKRIAEIIKKENFKHFYLLFGEEELLVKQAKDALKKALAGDDTTNLHVYTDKNINIPEIIDLAETMPFLAERRVFVIERSGLFKSGGEQLAEYLSNPCETAYFIFAEQEVDKRSKFYKLVNSEGMALEFAKQTEEQLKVWIASYLGAAGLRIREDTAARIIRGTGLSRGLVKGELEKLIAFCNGREEVTIEDVEAVSAPVAEDKIFEMMDALSNKNQKKALKLYYDLLTLHEAPMKILALLTRQLNLTYQGMILKEKNYSSGDIAKKIGVAPFYVAKYASPKGGISKEQYKEALVACAQAEEDIKTGKMGDRIAVEYVIMSILKG